MARAALVKRSNTLGMVADRKLGVEDMTDAALPTLWRATALRTPQALEVSHALAQINGRPLGDRVLVLALPENDRFGSIIIPQVAQEEQICGIVVSVGKGRYENGVLIPVEVVCGNYVTFSKYAGRKIQVGSVEVVQISETDITFAAGH